MVRNTFKLNRANGLLLAALALLSPVFIINNTNATRICNAEMTVCTCDGTGSCAIDGTFQVSVGEILTVDVAKPDTWTDNKGEYDEFLTNKVSLTVSTNNTQGFQASMTAKTTETGLTNTSASSSIPTLSSDNVAPASFPTTGAWGFGLTTLGGTAPTAYNPIVAKNASVPSLIMQSTAAESKATDIYFGAKGSNTTPSGTYSNTVLISVVSGVHDDTEPVTPVTPLPDNPSEPTTDNNNPGGTVAYNENGAAGTPTGNTVYTNTYTSGTSPNTTTHTYSEITSGNNTSNYNGYQYPQGVTTTTTAAINEGTPLATGLAITAGVAAVAGVAFFLAAKRRSDDDEEDDI
ncbi:hypothetical protein IKG68_01220 [Candidatus Saccharibacteria bacterium]|nr:hypothetical protein [Candidatus Saccharibacteria bacterium]